MNERTSAPSGIGYHEYQSVLDQCKQRLSMWNMGNAHDHTIECGTRSTTPQFNNQSIKMRKGMTATYPRAEWSRACGPVASTYRAGRRACRVAARRVNSGCSRLNAYWYLTTPCSLSAVVAPSIVSPRSQTRLPTSTG